MRGGFIGVDVFFVISGYLISTIILENTERGTFSFTEFYIRRIKRIFPALLLVLTVSYAFGWVALLSDEFKQLGKHIAAGAGFVSNIVFWSEAGYFDNAAETKPLQHLWSLGIEEQFYIVWPLMLWVAARQKFGPLVVIALMAIVSFYLNIQGIVENPIATFYSPQTRFWELLTGSLLAWVSLNKNSTFAAFWIKLNTNQRLNNLLACAGLLILGWGFWAIDKNSHFPGWWAVVPVMGTLLIIFANSQAWVNRVILSNKFAIWVGLISYPLYLWHWPLLSFARVVEGGTASSGIRTAAVALAVVLAWLTYKLLEGPLRHGKHSKIIAALLLLLMCIVGSLGYYTYMHEGLAFRLQSH